MPASRARFDFLHDCFRDIKIAVTLSLSIGSFSDLLKLPNLFSSRRRTYLKNLRTI